MRVWPEGGKLGIAVSGGPDSLALLLLAARSLPVGTVEAATVDHGLRPESASEAQMVATACAGLSIRHETLPVTVPDGNLQSGARTARYSALSAWATRRDIGAIATAHHADDQAETFIMRLNRGSGVSGLAGVRARGVVPGSRLPLIRPVLDWRREELGAVVRFSGLEAAQDPTNSDDKYDRVRVRSQLADCDWLFVPALARSAAHLAEASDALDWAAQIEWQERVVEEDDSVSYRPFAPRIIRIRVVERVLGRFGGSARGGEIARLADALEAGEGATLGGVQARSADGTWTFRKEPARRN